MATGYDGTIRIDTNIDGKGFNSGMRGMIGSVGKLAVAIGAAFAVKAVTNFAKSAVDAASEMASTMVGLQSIVEGTGNSWSKAKDFIKEFTADGLVPATAAATSLKNLLAAGFTLDQAEQALTMLKDAAAFGRQRSLTMGDALMGGTEGIKNDNSILLDNTGVTKNLVKMYQEYADSIGVSVNALTRQQKAQAVLNGLMQETRFQTGDAAKLANTYSGQVSQITTSLYNLRVAVGNTIIPIIQTIMPYIKAAIDVLVVFFNRLATIMSLLFGIDMGANAKATEASMGGVADATNEAASAQENLGNQTKKAAKAAKGALAAFDELNVLQMEDKDASAGAGGSGAGAGIGAGGLNLPTAETEEFDSAMVALEIKVNRFRQNMTTLFQPATEAFGRFKTALEPLGEKLWEGLKWGWDNVLVPLGEWTISEILPRIFDLLAIGADNLNIALEALRPLGEWLWENLLKPLGEWTGSVILDALDWLAVKFKEMGEWIKNNEEAFRTLTVILGVVAIALFFILSPAALIVVAIIAIIAAIAWLIQNWDLVKKKAGEVWDWIKQKWSEAGAWFTTTVIEPIKKGFNTALDSIKQTWENTFNGIKSFVKNIINGIIGFINGMIRSVVDGINAVIRAMNGINVTIPSWIPIYGGSSFGLNIPSVSAPQIPMLAKGAVIPPNAEFAAILGDQRSGRNIETPEALMRQIVREEMQGGIGGDVTVSMPVYLDGELIYQNQKKVSMIHGKSLLKGGIA